MRDLTVMNVAKAPESQHRVTQSDNKRINDWYSREPEWEGRSYVPSDFTGMTLESVSEATSDMDFTRETLLILVDLIFPGRYNID